MYIKNMFARDYNLNGVDVIGEVSNCKYHSSGHVYFTLKDSSSQISCVMFASAVRTGLKFKLENGAKVIVRGQISVYERDGKYQIYVKKVDKEGKGNLHEELEKIKKKLIAEGLFDDDHKQAIPKYAKKIGVVTSRTGAVIQDILNVSHRRNPFVQIILYPANVQGDGADKTIIDGINYFNKTDVDTIIIGRGGGSMEDLWCFNSENLARVIFASKKPIISAVGHETDFTIADFVSDIRVPTPSAAAEIAVFDYEEYMSDLLNLEFTLKRSMKELVSRKREKIIEKERLLKSYGPHDLIKQRRLYIDTLDEKLKNLMNIKVKDKKHALLILVEAMKGVSPLNKLSSGYAFVAGEDGKGIKSVLDIKENDELKLTFTDGKAKVKVLEVENGRG